MKLIVGLGNPGKVYSDTRHNVGFALIKQLAKKYKVSLKKPLGYPALSGKGKIEGVDVILAMPLTFMNLSGRAVGSLLKKYRIELNNLLVVYDDLDLEQGRIKIRPEGSSAGHNGLKSIIEAFGGREDFSRLRIGIGRPASQRADIADYVLSSFTKKEKEIMGEVLERSVDCCRSWAVDGIAEAMNAFNKNI